MPGGVWNDRPNRQAETPTGFSRSADISLSIYAAIESIYQLRSANAEGVADAKKSFYCDRSSGLYLLPVPG